METVWYYYVLKATELVKFPIPDKTSCEARFGQGLTIWI